MKLKLFLCLIGGLVFVGFGLMGTGNFSPDKKALETLQKQPISLLIEQTKVPVRGSVIRPATTAELKTLMTPSSLKYVPRLFVDRLPDDFRTEGDKELFAKVFLALILRENEKILTDRAIYLLLVQKQQAGQPWTPQETAFFDFLVKKYDSGARRTQLTKLADLDEKINTIPPFLAVIQAAEATDWGTKNLESPFEQTGWLDTKTYDRIPFDSLLTATESYAREMNGMPPFSDWRFSRFHLGTKGHNDVGYRALQWIGAYKIEDPDYPHKLYDRVRELDAEIPDNAAFFPSITILPQTPVIIGHKTYRLEMARSDTDKATGLMFRRSLPTGTGMIFPNKTPTELAFWMRNTFIPLDVLFYDSNHRIKKIVQNAQPLDETVVSSDGPVLGFIELPAGTVASDHLQIGDPVEF